MNHIVSRWSSQEPLSKTCSNGHADSAEGLSQGERPQNERRGNAGRRGGPLQDLERRAIGRLLSRAGDPPLTVAYRGEEIANTNEPPRWRLHIRDRRTLWRVAVDPFFEFAEGYSAGNIAVEGDFTELLTYVFRAFAEQGPGLSLTDRVLDRIRRRRMNTLTGSRDNISHHYDIGNDFYRLWLDEQMVYTCAYFTDPANSLEEAQLAKMDHVCRKVRLQPGQQVLEAGCGWGSLALHMAEHYGVTVKAFNISAEQIAYARRRAAARGLGHRVEFIHDDWRNMRQPCDAFVSVGMLEHVGLENFQRLGQTIDRCLRPDGLGLIHSIGQNYPGRFNPWLERRIFPGAHIPALSEITQVFEPVNLSVLDVENLRLHYARTLRHWRIRFEQSLDQVRRMFDERFVRMWRMYLCGAEAGFAAGVHQLFQVVFARSANNHIPWTRGHLYDGTRCDASSSALFQVEPHGADSSSSLRERSLLRHE